MTERPSVPKKQLLAEWIEELLPHDRRDVERDAGSQPLDLEALERKLRRSIDRRAAARRHRAA